MYLSFCSSISYEYAFLYDLSVFPYDECLHELHLFMPESMNLFDFTPSKTMLVEFICMTCVNMNKIES